MWLFICPLWSRRARGDDARVAQRPEAPLDLVDRQAGLPRQAFVVDGDVTPAAGGPDELPVVAGGAVEHLAEERQDVPGGAAPQGLRIFKSG